MRTRAIRLKLMLLVPLAWTNDAKGKFFEGIVANILKGQRYDVQQRIRFTGMELDLLATHQDTHQRAFIECKFMRDTISSNAIDILIGKSIRREADLAFLFSTSPPSKEAQGILEEMAKVPPRKFPHFAFIGPEKLTEIFSVAYSTDFSVRADETVDAATLVIAPKLMPFWVLEEESNPLAPLRIQPSRPDSALLAEDVQSTFDEAEVFSGRIFEVETLGSITSTGHDQLLLRRSGSFRQETIDALFRQR